MAKVYKVWVCIEEYDTETDRYSDEDVHFGDNGEYPTYEEAAAEAERIHNS